MRALDFDAEILIYQANPYVLVTAQQAEQLKPGWRKPMPVLVQINGQPKPAWRINMMPVGDGSFYLYLHGDVRKASKTKVGDSVQVHLRFDADYRNGPQHPLPEWFQAALDADPLAKQHWEALIPSRQKEILRYFAALKSDDAKQRNLQKAMQVLHGDNGRFMARTWKDGT